MSEELDYESRPGFASEYLKAQKEKENKRNEQTMKGDQEAEKLYAVSQRE